MKTPSLFAQTIFKLQDTCTYMLDQLLIFLFLSLYEMSCVHFLHTVADSHSILQTTDAAKGYHPLFVYCFSVLIVLAFLFKVAIH